jgi:predicted RNase H-like HicB family nuclease
MSRRVHYIALTFKIIEEEGQYSVVCEELGTASCGDTIDEAMKNIREAVVVDLNALEQVGERNRFFRERGIRMHAQPLKTSRKPINAAISEVITRQNMPVYA